MSTFFVWDAGKYSVYAKEMDDEHIHLIGLMNKLYDRHEAGAAKPEVGKLLTDLLNYVKKHFSSEERFFDSLKFSGASVHKKIHEELLRRVSRFAEDFEKGDGKISMDFFNFLKIWLASHIAGADRMYGVEYKSKKAS